MANAKWLEGLSPADRLRFARERVDTMIDTMIGVLQLHEANRIVVFSEILSTQLRGHAIPHYRGLQTTLLQAEISRLCTFWDPPSEHRNSLRSVVLLLSDAATLDRLREANFSSLCSGPVYNDLGLDPLQIEELNLADRNKSQAETSDRMVHLVKTFQIVDEIRKSSLLRAVRDFRNMHLAHSLRPEAKEFVDLSAKYGDERKLLERTLPLLDNLNLCVRQSQFFWEDSISMAKRNARAFWCGLAWQDDEPRPKG